MKRFSNTQKTIAYIIHIHQENIVMYLIAQCNMYADIFSDYRCQRVMCFYNRKPC